MCNNRDTDSPYLRANPEIGTSCIDWAQLSRPSTEDGGTVKSPQLCFKQKHDDG
jgi:hypothetical protein